MLLNILTRRAAPSPPREAQGPSVDGAELEKPRYKLCSHEKAADVCHPRKEPARDPVWARSTWPSGMG